VLTYLEPVMVKALHEEGQTKEESGPETDAVLPFPRVFASTGEGLVVENYELYRLGRFRNRRHTIQHAFRVYQS
jgi:hypothetical protein